MNHIDDHYLILADRMIADLQMATLNLCAAQDADEKRQRTEEVARLASLIRRHIADSLQKHALF